MSNLYGKIRGLKIYSEKLRGLKILGFSEENTPGGYSPLKMTRENKKVDFKTEKALSVFMDMEILKYFSCIAFWPGSWNKGFYGHSSYIRRNKKTLYISISMLKKISCKNSISHRKRRRDWCWWLGVWVCSSVLYVL